MHPKHVIKDIFKILFSESSVSQIDFDLVSISKDIRSNFRGFTVDLNALKVTGTCDKNQDFAW